MRWQNPENRNMGVTTLAYWADALQQICPTGASTLPMMGKHVAPVGQAACPILTQIGRQGLLGFWIFRRMDFVWLLMSNSELLRIKNKQKTPYKKQKTASSY